MSDYVGPNCPKTVTGYHNWAYQKYEDYGYYQTTKPLENNVCIYCGLVDDRPKVLPQKEGK